MAGPKPLCDGPTAGGDFGDDTGLPARTQCRSSAHAQTRAPDARAVPSKSDAARHSLPSLGNSTSVDDCAADASASDSAATDRTPRSSLDGTDPATADDEPRKLLQALTSSVSCLIVTDVQRDFCEGGALGGEGRVGMVHNINRLRCWRSAGTGHRFSGVPFEQLPTSLEAADVADELFDYVVVSRDWHPPNHLSFARNHGSNCNREACVCGDEQEESGDPEPGNAASDAVRSTGKHDGYGKTAGTQTRPANEQAPKMARKQESVNGRVLESEANGSGNSPVEGPATVSGSVSDDGRATKKSRLEQQPLGPNQVRRRRTGVVLDLWPVHCVQNMPGAELHPDLLPRASDVTVYKATDREFDSYSCFGHDQHKTPLESLLREWKVETVCVVGLCIDYCVKATALAAVQVPGVQTVSVLLDCSKAVDEEAIPDVRRELRGKGIIVCAAKEMLQ
ncbi:putative pyrazinamidase/nicotinamidase [Neospora caninum Liverpool]|uniref:nicotinamidase n=1 Tax=Neospora caninum (strain Liverpool) TaxID=572307 RepID=F0VFT5_NEOCL|nr:putative pyrazinamidase/nicotinamidase [Neospora caninum Liverpool]CBZ52579.1 putative pyrazinamidase/nicotinamidase [Neospora caninum Liverpool]CEL66556.1 TPA: pyrazinamidase/nicotinamidase, putative [Neospora caninum Liverpool]|eukprot:XP_003882611.1 putative pyrazinamidase/nicotinamidase [Neospora caninum Liverpool]